MFKDLTGDPLYDHFKKFTKEGFSITGGRIIENTNHKVYSPRKEIEIQVTDGKIIETYKYNYNKLLKELDEKR